MDPAKSTKSGAKVKSNQPASSRDSSVRRQSLPFVRATQAVVTAKPVATRRVSSVKTPQAVVGAEAAVTRRTSPGAPKTNEQKDVYRKIYGENIPSTFVIKGGGKSKGSMQTDGGCSVSPASSAGLSSVAAPLTPASEDSCGANSVAAPMSVLRGEGVMALDDAVVDARLAKP